MMNDVERLHGLLVGRFPDLKIELDPTEIETGPWFVFVFRPGLAHVAVEWSAHRGFGISTPGPDDYGTGVDEAYPSTEATFDRVVQLVLSGGETVPPLAVRLAELRQLRGLTQTELAERAGLAQANLSRFENQDDMKLSTLQKVINALGASLTIVARLPDGTGYELRV
jgi:DNA-binding Xre family transcriptional regulator